MTDRSRQEIKRLIAQELGITMDEMDMIETCGIISAGTAELMGTVIPASIVSDGGVEDCDWVTKLGDASNSRTVPLPNITVEEYQLFEASALYLLNLLRMGMYSNGHTVPPSPPTLLLPFELATA